MSFLNPLMLWGLAGVGVPVLVHLLNLYRHQETDWAAMRFLSRAARVRSRQIRLKDVLLMLLRCMAVLLFVLALARPVLRFRDAPAAIGEARAGVVIAIDGSYSMSHTVDGQSRFKRAVERAKEITETLKQGDPCALVLVGAQHRVLVRAQPYDPARFEAALDSLAPLAEHAELESLPQTIAMLLSDMTAAQKEAYLITDVQARDWLNASAEAKSAFRNIATYARVSLAPVRSGGSENIAVTDFHLTSGTMRQDSLARYTAQVKNFGTQPRQAVRVVCRVNDDPVDERIIESLAPGEQAIVALYAPFSQSGRIRVRAEIPADELSLDNTRHAVAHVREQMRVLCVDGSPSVEPYEGATAFLVSALSLPRSSAEDAPLDVDTIPWSALSTVSFDQHEVVVLANVAEVPEFLAPKLNAYVQAGGGLIVFAGPNVRPDVWNERLVDGPIRLLPARMAGLAEEPFDQHDGWPLDTALTDHPLCSPLTALPSDLLGQIRFWRYMALTPIGDAQVAMRIAPDGAPLLVEGHAGRGRVVMFASSANRDWQNMVINPAFPMLAHQMIASVTREDMEVPVPVGSPIVVPLDDMDLGEVVVFIEPTGRTTNSQTIERQGRVVGVFDRAEQVGFHRVQCAVATPAFTVAVNPVTSESDVRVLTNEQINRLAGDLKMDVLRATGSVASEIIDARVGRELWMPLLLLAALAIAGEALLAHLLSRKRTGRLEVAR